MSLTYIVRALAALTFSGAAALAQSPTLSSISPNRGAPGTAVNVTLTGTNFQTFIVVLSDNPGVTITNPQFVSATQATATLTIAVSASGAANLTINTAGGLTNSVTFSIVTPSPFSCTTVTAIPSLLRIEGLTESTDDIVIQCTGGSPVAAGVPVPAVNLTIFFNTNATSRLIHAAPPLSEALLVVGEPGSGLPGTTAAQRMCQYDRSSTCPITGTGNGGNSSYDGSAPSGALLYGRPNIYQGLLTGNEVSFFGVPVDPPGIGDPLIFRFTNLRADATRVPQATPILASISSSVYSAFPLGNPGATLGMTRSGLNFSLRTPDDSADSSGFTLTPCSSSGAQLVGVLRFAEGFNTAFRTRTSAQSTDGESSPAPAVQNLPGQPYASESRFYAPALPELAASLLTVGLADSGTRLKALFTGLPAGSRIFVSPYRTNFVNGSPVPVITGPTTARLVQSETGPFVAAPISLTVGGVPAVELPLASGQASAVWEVLSADPSQLEQFDFPVWILPSGGLSAHATVTGSLAPVVSGGSAGSASDTLPVPRFSSTLPAQLLLTTGPCPSISVSAANLSFQGASGGANPTPQAVTVTSAGSATSYTVQTTTLSGGSWLSVAPAAGTTPGTVLVSATTGALTAGSYQGIVTINTPQATPASQTIAVTFTVGPAAATPLALNCQPSAVDQVGVSFSATCVASGGVAPYVLSLSAGAAPPGVSVQPVTATSITVSGTPTTAGPYSFTIQVLDREVPAKSAFVTITGTIAANASTTYSFPHIAFGGGYQTTLTYVNYSPQSVTCQTNFLSDTGTPLQVPFAEGTLTSRSDSLAAGARLHVQTTATGGALSGWAQVQCTGPVKASLLYRLSNNQGVAMGEASLNAATTPTTEFVTFAETRTGVAYANPSSTTATITITALDSSGLFLGNTAVVLAPNAHGAANIGPLLGLKSFTGSVQVTSTVPIVSLALNAEAYTPSNPVFSSLPPGDLPASTALATGSVAGTPVPASSPSTYSFPHVAFGGGYQTTLTYVNYSPQSVSCQTNFLSDSGAPLQVPFPEGALATRTDNLAPGASSHVQTTATGGALSGWAQVQCSGPVKASLLYRLSDAQGVALGEASLNAATTPTTEFVSFAETRTGVAYANPSASTATITIAALDAAGSMLGSTVIALAPNAHGAANIGPLLKLASFTGSVQIASTAPIVSLALNAEAYTPLYPVFSSLPPGDLPPNTPLAAGH